MQSNNVSLSVPFLTSFHHQSRPNKEGLGRFGTHRVVVMDIHSVGMVALLAMPSF
jgi:hypothetical protein